MTQISITRKEFTTYSTIVEVSDAMAESLLKYPSTRGEFEERDKALERLCPASKENWQDADDAEYEVEEYKED